MRLKLEIRRRPSPRGAAGLLLSLALAGASPAQCEAEPPTFLAVPAPQAVLAGNTLPPIVLPFEAATRQGFDWDRLRKLNYYQAQQDPDKAVINAVEYLSEAVQRMTGQVLPVAAGRDFARGFVLTTLELAPPEIRDDAEVRQALRPAEHDAYNANEAFFVRSERGRVLIVANTPTGLQHGVVHLMESVGYEVLGMGPNWTYVPDFRHRPLLFSLKSAGRPGFYIRHLGATSGQVYGIGTLFLKPLADPADETVDISYKRWNVGMRLEGRSMSRFPGHALQAYHRQVVAKMRAEGLTDGFLVPHCTVGPDAARPAAGPDNKGYLWINNDGSDQPAGGKIFSSDGERWVEGRIGGSLDLSVPFVRKIILEDMKQRAAAFFAKLPGSAVDEIFVFGTDPEDGTGYARAGELLHFPHWYPEYRTREGMPLGQPYALHGFCGLNQPRELWDSAAVSDTVFAFNNWLLHEFDKWIDGLPPAERIASTGKSKKELVRASLYSYNFHDVPPNFNLDPRIRVQIAGFPKNRGRGKWRNFAANSDLAQAFTVLLPREPAANYWIMSAAYHRDMNAAGIGGSPLAGTIQRKVKQEYAAGIRALSVETDFNSGKMGLAYYLYARLLWNPALSAEEVDKLRDRWFQRAFGNGWKEMKRYYDFMAPENATVNAPNRWAKAITLLAAADAAIDRQQEPAAQQRLDELKQYWYFYYLLESGQAKPASRIFREFVWKGQMSYMTPMYAVTQRFFQTNNVRLAAGSEFNTGPAHYSAAETDMWWAKVRDFWKLTPVTDFAETNIQDGRPARDVDLNDLVRVAQFDGHSTTTPLERGFLYNSASHTASLLTTASRAGEEIGFHLFWPWNAADSHYQDKEIYYGIHRWVPGTRTWQELVDITTSSVHSEPAKDSTGRTCQLATARFKVPEKGTYRIEIGRGGNVARLAPLGYNLSTGQFAQGLSDAHVFFETQTGLPQGPAYIYIPKGTHSLDLEVWDTWGKKSLTLLRGLPASGLTPGRKIDLSARGTHTIALQPGEDGGLAMLSGTSMFAFPHLYSVPQLFSKTPATLLVPRAVAMADGLSARE